MLRRNKAVNHKKGKKGQTTIEYLVLVTGVIAFLILFLKPGGPFATAYNQTFSTATNDMVNMAGKLSTSHN